MKSHPRQSPRNPSRHSLDSLSQEMLHVFTRRLHGDVRDDDEFRLLTWEFHRLGDPDKDKLRVKDKLLVAMTAAFRQAVDAALKANDITRTEAKLFHSVADIFDQVEAILWELKKLPGEPPKYPHPPKSPEPTPPDPKNPK